MRLRAWQRRWTYGALLVVFLTGLILFLLMEYGQVEGDFGPRPHPWQGSVLAWHGGAAMLWLIALGTLAEHVRAGWKAGQARLSGSLQLLAHGVLALTGFALYYVGDETWQARSRTLHLWIGLAVPALLVAHLWARANPRARPTIRTRHLARPRHEAEGKPTQSSTSSTEPKGVI